MEAMLLGGGDSDSDDDSAGEVEVIGGSGPVSMAPAAASIPIASIQPAPVVAAPAAAVSLQPAPVPRPMPVPAPIPIPVSRPAMAPAPTPIRNTAPVPSVNAPPPVARQIQQMPGPSGSSIPPHAIPMAGSRPVPTPQMSQNEKLKSLYKQSAPVASVAPAATTASRQPMQPQPHQTYQSQPPPNTSANMSISIEPTPLTVIQGKPQGVSVPSHQHPMHSHNRSIQQRQQPQQQPQQQQQQLQRPSAPQKTSSSSYPQYNRSVGSSSQADPHQSSKERKEQFLMFTKVLMKYLEQKDQSMHARAKEVIRDCAKKNKEGNPSYSSLSTSMQSHLKQLVGEPYWKKAEDYLRQYLHTQYVKKGVPHEEAKRKANATAQSAASPLALDGVIVPPSVPVGHQARQHHGQPINSGHAIPPRRTSVVQPPPSSELKSSTNAAAAAAAAQQQASYNVKIQQQREQEQARRTQEMKIAAQKAAAAKKNSAAKNNLTVTNPISTVGSGGKTASGKSGKGVRPGVGGKTPVGSPPTKTKKTSKTKKPTPAASAAAAREAAALSVPKEYSDAMKMLDHVVDYDVSSCALILGKDSKKKGQSIISEEQRKLLYHDFGITEVGPRKGLYGGRKQSESPTSVTSDTVGGRSAVPSFLKGWGERNIVSSRVAWAKLRLEEDDEQTIGGLSLSGSIVITATNREALSSPSLSQSADVSDSTWFNDETAEDDETLALISEATQHYIKTALEGAMNSASKRLNLDGIRLWHQQHAVASMREAQVSDKFRDPPLHLRLGCDTRRQYSLLQGNAAKTYQRLEEALSRQEPIAMNSEAVYNATSMTELSKIPKISSAATKADYNAKRSYEIYGGKESGEPPVGRVPKKAKIMARDFRVCLEESSFAISRKRVTTSAFF